MLSSGSLLKTDVRRNMIGVRRNMIKRKTRKLYMPLAEPQLHGLKTAL